MLGTAFEGLEDALLVFEADPRPRVADRDHEPAGVVGHEQIHAALDRELYGVAQQVDQDLPQTDLVGMNLRRDVVVDTDRERQALVGRHRSHHGRNVVQQAEQVELIVDEFDLAGIQAGIVEHRLNQVGEMPRRAGHGLDAFVHVVCAAVLLQRKLSVVDDRRQRRTKLVRHHRDETALVLADPFRLPTMMVQCRFSLDELADQLSLPRDESLLPGLHE